MNTRVVTSLLTLLVAGCVSSTPVAPKPPVVVTNAPVVEASRTDENDPLTHVEQLQNPRVSATAVRRLVQFFDDAMAKDKRNLQGPNVKPLLDKIVEPLAQRCIADDVNDKERSIVLKFLADAGDPRGAPCFIKTLEEYEPETTDEQVRMAARAVAAIPLKTANAALFTAFTKVNPSKPQGGLIYRDVNEAMIAVSDPSWETPCIKALSIPIQDRRDLDTLRGEMFRQVTCARILGHLRSDKAIPNLIKLMLSPVKADIQSAAVYALVKIGKPAIPPLVAILQGVDKESIEYAKLEYLRAAHTDAPGSLPPAQNNAASSAYITPVAVMLGAIGRDEAMQPMIEMMAKADAVDKVIVARDLLKLPITPAALEQVKRVYEKTSLTLMVPPGMSARSVLIEQLAYTFDSQLVPWLAKETIAQKGDAADLDELRANALLLALKLAKFDQIRDIDTIGNLPSSDGPTIGKGYEKEVNATKKLLTACRENVDCYLAKLVDPDVHRDGEQFVGVKCAYMVGILGGPDVRAKLVDVLPRIIGSAARFVVMEVIDHHSPKGDVVIAGQLQKMIDDAEAAKDTSQITALSFFRPFIGRLVARTQ